MNKQEVIKKAYGDFWQQCKDFVDENGWIETWKCIKAIGVVPKYGWQTKTRQNPKDNLHRPKSLKGIEDNNGWVKIESKADLPKKGTSCHYITKSGVEGTFIDIDDYQYLHLRNRSTHYFPITKPEPPIF